MNSQTALDIYWINILAFPQEDAESFGIQPAVDPIIELQSPAKFKPKRRPPGAKNKKRSVTQADLERSTPRDPSRFEHEAKTRKTGTRGQDDTRAKEDKGENKVEEVVIRESKTELKRPKYRLIARALMEKRGKYKLLQWVQELQKDVRT